MEHLNSGKVVNNSIKYLDQVSEVIGTLNKELKTLYSLERQEYMLMNGESSLEESRRVTIVCTRCCTRFPDDRSGFSVQPCKRQSKFAIKTLQKQKEGKILTKFQTKYLKKLKPHSYNKLVILCPVCKHETKVPLQKPSLNKVVVKRDPNEDLVKMKKKKKKRKDKFCGLNQSCMPLNLNNNHSQRQANEAQRKLFPPTIHQSLVPETKMLNCITGQKHGVDHIIHNTEATKTNNKQRDSIKMQQKVNAINNQCNVNVTRCSNEKEHFKNRKNKFTNVNVASPSTNFCNVNNIPNRILERKEMKNKKAQKKKLHDILNKDSKGKSVSAKLKDFLDKLQAP